MPFRKCLPAFGRSAADLWEELFHAARGEDQQHSPLRRPDVGPRVADTARNHNACTRRRIEFVVTDAKAKRALQDFE